MSRRRLISDVMPRLALGQRRPTIAVTAFVVALAGLGAAGASPAAASITQGVTATIPVGNLPVAVAVNQLTSRVYVVNEESNTVSVINPATDAVTATIPVGTVPFAVAVNQRTGRVYVANTLSNTVSVIAPPRRKLPPARGSVGSTSGLMAGAIGFSSFLAGGAEAVAKGAVNAPAMR